MRTTIKDIAYHLPERIVTNGELHEENPDWDMAYMEDRVGVVKRHIARDDETALDLALEACLKLFSNNTEFRDQLDVILFCTQSADYIMPTNACILQNRLNLREDVFAFDITLGCSGYIYGLALSQALIHSGMRKNVLLITADTMSKYTHQQDRSTRVLLGDGAAASWIAESDSSRGIIDVQCFTSGDTDRLIIPAGGCRMPRSDKTAVEETDRSGNVRTLEDLHIDGMGLLGFVNTKMPEHIQGILKANNLTLDDIDEFVWHQASNAALDTLSGALNIEPKKVFRNLREIGNTASASIPIALKDAWDCGDVSSGDKVLLCGFGVGLSWGSAIMEF